MKYAWLAALLNIFPYPLGFGYLYLGRPGRFTLAFNAGLVAGVIGFVGGLLSAFASGSALEMVVAMAWAVVVVGMFTAWDGWRLAVAHNATLGTQQGVLETADDHRLPLEMTTFGKAFAATAVTIVALSIVSRVGTAVQGTMSSYYSGFWVVLYVAAGIWVLGLFMGIVLGLAGRRAIANGILAGIGVGFFALVATCSANLA